MVASERFSFSPWSGGQSLLSLQWPEPGDPASQTTGGRDAPACSIGSPGGGSPAVMPYAVPPRGAAASQCFESSPLTQQRGSTFRRL